MGYKLYYFNMRGLAEPIRYLLKYGKIDFEDVRVEREDWPKLKETMPMKQMPVLEIDGKKVFQSVSICRFLAKQVGLAGSTDLENLEIDSVVDTFVDLRLKITQAHFAPEDKKAEAMKLIVEETLPFFLGRLNSLAEANDGHLACKKLTWADFYFSALKAIVSLAAKSDSVWPNYPALKKVTENVENLDAIKTWIAERPVTDF